MALFATAGPGPVRYREASRLLAHGRPTPVRTPTTASGHRREAFADKFGGQWEGQSAVFDSSGQPEALPDHLVPQALKDWEMHPHDWQTRCLSSVREDTASVKVIRLTPTVGCEAEEKAAEAEQTDVLLLVRDDGSCIARSRRESDIQRDAQLCFQLSTESRLRILLQLKSGQIAPGSRIKQIELHHEHKYGSTDQPFQPLEAEGTVRPFAVKDILQPAMLRGSWTTDTDYWSADTPSCADRMSAATEEAVAVRLPLQAFVAQLELVGQQLLMVGTYLSKTERYCSSLLFGEDGELVGIGLGKQHLKD